MTRNFNENVILNTSQDRVFNVIQSRLRRDQSRTVGTTRSTQRLLVRLALLPVILTMMTLPALAQVDLIVKVSDPTGPSALTLGRAASKYQLDEGDPLLSGVLSVKPLFAVTSANRSGKSSDLDGIYMLSLPDSASLAVRMNAWASRGDVEYAIGNHQYRVETPPQVTPDYNDTHFDSLTHLPLIRAIDAWEVTRGSPTVRIGVIDTGVFKDHPDLAGQFWANPAEDLNGNGILDEADLNGIDDDDNGYVDDVVGYDFVDRARAVDQGDYFERDPDASEDRLSPLAPRRGGFGHGTLVAGVVSAALDNGLGVAGVAPGSKMVPIRAFGIDGLAEDDDVAAAIAYAADNGLDVVNLSFGDTYYSPLMADAVRYATSLGTTVVASGGNVGTDEPHYPSDYSEAIGALWLSRDGLSRGSRASYGVGVDVGAPGSLVFTTLMPAPDDIIDDATADSVLYGYRSGSSLAAPQVTGAVALLKSVDQTLTPASVKSILTSTAFDLDEPGWDYETAAGRLDIAAALALPYPASVQITSPKHDSGLAGSELTVTGSAVSSLFESYSIWYGPETDGEEPDWKLATGPVNEQKRREVLGTVDISGLEDDTYVLRLEVNLVNGQSIEDRRRIFIDRTPPEVSLITTDAALIDRNAGIQAELTTDDLSTVTMTVSMNGSTETVSSDRKSRRHGQSLVWSDLARRGGKAQVVFEVTNVSGLRTRLDPLIVTVPAMPNPGYLAEFATGLPAGFLLREETDLDGDRRPEIVFNRYREGWLGDTVKVAEWAGDRFRTSANLVANSFPRDLGDTDADGNPEILLQVSAWTRVIEFSNNGSTVDIVFEDTAGLANPGADSAAWGAALTDLDGDGWGEVVTHNRNYWRLFEFRPDGYVEVAQLQNPTPEHEADPSGILGSEANGFAEPQAVAGDFDSDGRGDLLVSDTDGDFIVFESTGDDMYEPVWFHLTPRFTSQGSRLTTGDYDGDGNREFVGYTHAWLDPRFDGEYDARYGVYYFFEATGDNNYQIRDSLIVADEVTNHGSLASVDFDGDDAEEVVVAHPPNLYVLKPDRDGRWRILFHRGDMGSALATGIRSISMVAGDLDLNGIPDLMAAGADERLHRFEWSSTGTRLPPPSWISAFAIDAASVSLTWNPGQSDSTAVYRRSGASDYDLIAVTTGGSLTDSPDRPSIYTLVAYHGGEPSPLSEERRINPHEPAKLVSASWQADFLVFGFDRALPARIEPGQLTLSGGQLPVSAQTTKTGLELVVHFEPAPSEGDTVYWHGLVDAEGTPLADAFGLVPPRSNEGPSLFLTDWEALSTSRARLVFSLALDPQEAESLENYRVDPNGTVSTIEFDPATPREVELDVIGRALGPTGFRTSIVVLNMLSADGTRLASEGTVATFASSAETLSEAYVFPNPYRADQHRASIMIAGLPNRSTIEIFTSSGYPIRTLEERDGDGGVAWDLKDDSGSLVESGIYVIRIETESEESVMLKSAVIR